MDIIVEAGLNWTRAGSWTSNLSYIPAELLWALQISDKLFLTGLSNARNAISKQFDDIFVLTKEKHS